MNKGFMIALIIALVLVLIGLILMGVAWLRGTRSIDLNNLNIGFGNLRLDSEFGKEDFDSDWNDMGSYSVPADGIHSVEVLWVSGTASIRPADTADIRFTETCREPLTEKNSLRWQVKDGVLTIQYRKTGHINFGKMPEKELEVLLPQALAESLRELNVSNVSGNVRTDGMTARRFECSTVSGEMDLEAKAENLKLNTVSGRTQFRGFYTACEAASVSGELHIERTEDGSTAERTTVNTVSGAVQLHGRVGNFDVDATSGAVSILGSGQGSVETISGDQWLEGEIGALEADSTSGTVTLITGIRPREIDVDTASGNVSLTLPADCGFTVDYDTASGDFISTLALVNRGTKRIYGDGTVQVEVETISGDLTVEVR